MTAIEPTGPQAARPTARLFRREAVAHAGVRRHGTVILARPLSHAVLTALFVVIAVGILVFLCAFSYTRKVRVPGVLLPTAGLIRVVTPQAGRVTERRIDEGRPVHRGDVLFVLTSERSNAAGGNAEETIATLLAARRASLLSEEAQSRLQANQRVEASRRRVEDLAAEVRRAEDQIALQRRRVALGEQALGRYRELEAAHFVSAVQLQDRQAELLDQQQRLADLERGKAATARDQATAQASLRDQQVQAERDHGGIARTIAGLDQETAENAARREVLVVAPQDGTVTAITVEPGQAVIGNQRLAAILPADATLVAELYAPSRAAGFLRPGMPVLLRYQAYAYQKFGQARGTISEVSGSALRPEDLGPYGVALAAGSSAEPLYRVRVALERQSVLAYGAAQPLRSGAQLDASIVLETRHLVEWILEPLYTITGRA